MTDLYDFNSAEVALTEVIKILESDACFDTGVDDDLESLWADAKDIREEVRG